MDVMVAGGWGRGSVGAWGPGAVRVAGAGPRPGAGAARGHAPAAGGGAPRAGRHCDCGSDLCCNSSCLGTGSCPASHCGSDSFCVVCLVTWTWTSSSGVCFWTEIWTWTCCCCGCVSPCFSAYHRYLTRHSADTAPCGRGGWDCSCCYLPIYLASIATYSSETYITYTSLNYQTSFV